MKSLPGSQPLLGEIPPELVAGILGISYDASLSVSSPLSASGSLLLSVSFLSSSPVLLYRPLIWSLLLLFSVFISCSAHSLPPLFPAHLCFSPLHSPLSVFFSSVFPPSGSSASPALPLSFLSRLLPLFLPSPSAFILPLLPVFLSFSPTVFFFCCLLSFPPPPFSAWSLLWLL